MNRIADLIYVCFEKGGERYVLLYEVGREDETCDALGRWAANPELSLTAYEATMMVEAVRKRQDERCCGR